MAEALPKQPKKQTFTIESAHVEKPEGYSDYYASHVSVSMSDEDCRLIFYQACMNLEVTEMTRQLRCSVTMSRAGIKRLLESIKQVEKAHKSD